VPILPQFPGIAREAIIAVFDHSFRPKKDLIKLRSPEYKAFVPDDEAYGYKNTSSGLQLRKITSLKDWGHDSSLWAHCFTNYIAIWSSFFGNKHGSALVGMVLFLRRIMDLARSYRWQDCVLVLALDKHQLIIDRGDLTISAEDWFIEPSLSASYLRLDLVLSKAPSTTVSSSSSSSSRPTRSSATPNDSTVTCEKFNSSNGCSWKQCRRKHVCSNCTRDHPAHRCKAKEK
jgi:hypothetical protein